MKSEDNNSYAQFAQAEPKHYDRVPSIIDHLTYIDEVIDKKTGKKMFYRKRLTPTEKELYRIIRYRAGTGACWRGVRELAAHVGCSTDTITEAKKTLCMPFEQLEGNPLIYIEKKMVMTTRFGKNINKRPVHIITVGEIWRYNNAFMDSYYKAGQKRKTQIDINEQNVATGQEPISVDEEMKFPKRNELLSVEEAEIVIEKLSQPGPVSLVHNLGGCSENRTSQDACLESRTSSPGDLSEKSHVNKEDNNHGYKTNTKADALARCFLNECVVEDCFASQSRAMESIQKFGIKVSKASEIIRNHTLDELILSTIYLRDIIKKNKIKSSITGYFLKTLEHKWYLPRID